MLPSLLTISDKTTSTTSAHTLRSPFHIVRILNPIVHSSLSYNRANTTAAAPTTAPGPAVAPAPAAGVAVLAELSPLAIALAVLETLLKKLLTSLLALADTLLKLALTLLAAAVPDALPATEVLAALAEVEMDER